MNGTGNFVDGWMGLDWIALEMLREVCGRGANYLPSSQLPFVVELNMVIQLHENNLISTTRRKYGK